jgi:hypothetical protein
MGGEPSDFDPQKLWQGQATEYDPMTLAAIHEKARTLQARIKRRNAIEYIASAVVILGFIPTLLHHGSWLMRAGGACIIAATLFVVWELHRRAAAASVPETGEPAANVYRAELARQRDALRSVGAWYLAPFVPGMALLLLGRWFQSHSTRVSLGVDHLIILLGAAIAALVFLVIWLVNQRGADRLQRQIDEL